MTRLPTAHAQTVFVAFQMRQDTRYTMLKIPDLFRKAWEAQLTGAPTILKNVGVDKEYAENLEE